MYHSDWKASSAVIHVKLSMPDEDVTPQSSVSRSINNFSCQVFALPYATNESKWAMHIN